MTGFLLSRPCYERFGAAIREATSGAGLDFELVELPADPEARLGPEELARIGVAYFSTDIYQRGSTASFFAAALEAPNLKWLHVFNAGVDHPIFRGFIERGTAFTNSSGGAAEPIAQTAIGGLLMLARGFKGWAEAQRRHAWEPRLGDREDLRGQVLVVVGLGAIGHHIARLGQALGLHVVGVRRSPRRADDPVDEMLPPSQLAEVLPRCDWLALACPLTDETRRLIDAAAFSRLKRGARLLNVARGEVVDEAAMIEALRSGLVGGAYLDVFEQEPLPAESPLWDLPNVIISPHNSAESSGNDGRATGFFLRNIPRWARGEPMENRVS